MKSMVLTPGKGQIWLGTPPVVLQFFLVLFHLWSAIASSRKIFVRNLTLRKWQNAFDNICL